jgi:hypothetical protein
MRRRADEETSVIRYFLTELRRDGRVRYADWLAVRDGLDLILHTEHGDVEIYPGYFDPIYYQAFGLLPNSNIPIPLPGPPTPSRAPEASMADGAQTVPEADPPAEGGLEGWAPGFVY